MNSELSGEVAIGQKLVDRNRNMTPQQSSPLGGPKLHFPHSPFILCHAGSLPGSQASRSRATPQLLQVKEQLTFLPP